MRSTTRTYLIVCTCCVIALRALAMREPIIKEEVEEEEDLDSEDFADEEEELADIESGALGKLRVLVGRQLEPEAEMLPAHYEGVRPPGVDHMEMADKERRNLRPSQSRRRLVED